MNGKESFKYNVSFYYQSTIIYFVVFIVYVIIRGQFIEHSYTLFTNDPIIYFLGLIVIVSIIALLYNLYKNKHLEFSGTGISFVNRFKSRLYTFEQIKAVNIGREKKRERRTFRLVRIKIEGRRRPLIIRPSDYENEKELLQKFKELKSKIEQK